MGILTVDESRRAILLRALDAAPPVFYADDGRTYMLSEEDRQTYLALRQLLSVPVSALILSDEQEEFLYSVLSWLTSTMEPQVNATAATQADLWSWLSEPRLSQGQSIMEELSANAPRIFYRRKTPQD